MTCLKVMTLRKAGTEIVRFPAVLKDNFSVMTIDERAGGRVVSGVSPAAATDLTVRARAVLEAHWREPGFCVPNAATYPWQWLWDSCFHAVCWAHLGEGDRGLVELQNALAHQGADGFVPHITYWHGGDTHAAFWGRPGTSSITQPPMYGHALAELHRLGVAVPEMLIEQARLGLRYLLTARMRDGVGPVILHPWESGCDDSPRWDAWCPAPWSRERWKIVKGELVEAMAGGGSARFQVASAGFCALVVFNARELADIVDDADLRDAAETLAGQLTARWDDERRTWADHVLVGPRSTASVRTLDALLPVLVVEDEASVAAAFADVLDDRAFGGRCGPAATHRAEPAFDPVAYWRGPAWPQLTYLLWVAARRRGDDVAAAGLAGRLIAGATRSGQAEYWHPDTGEGLGAMPQSWTALAAVVSMTQSCSRLALRSASRGGLPI
jgi:glucosylglycerate hydrolase